MEREIAEHRRIAEEARDAKQSAMEERERVVEEMEQSKRAQNSSNLQTLILTRWV
jgi:hypothetical protein